MPEIDPKLIRSATCRRAFRLMMWGFLFLMPLAVPKTNVRPEVLGWVFMIVALRGIRGLHPDVGRLTKLAVAALVLSAAELAAIRFVPESGLRLALAVHIGTAAVAVTFVWKLCVLVADMAAHAGSRAVAKDASYRPWLYLISAVVPFMALVRPAGGGVGSLGVAMVAVLFAVCVISMMMGLMVTTARMCAQLAATAAQPAATTVQPPAATPDDDAPA